MIADLEELKGFILWAKQQKIKKLKVSEVEIELSDMAFFEDIKSDILEDKKEQVVQKDLMESTEEEPVSNEDLFWSAR